MHTEVPCRFSDRMGCVRFFQVEFFIKMSSSKVCVYLGQANDPNGDEAFVWAGQNIGECAPAHMHTMLRV